MIRGWRWGGSWGARECCYALDLLEGLRGQRSVLEIEFDFRVVVCIHSFSSIPAFPDV